MNPAQTVTIFVWLVFIVSGIAVYLLHRKLDEFKRYEFYNSSESGATTFGTYEDAKSFRRKQHFFKTLQNLLLVPLFFSGIGIVFFFMW